VDNGSIDGSAEAIRDEFPKVRLIAEAENHGFARATNISAVGARGRYLLLLNTDTVVLDGAVDAILAFAEAFPSAKIWGGRTLFGDKTLNPTSCWRRMTPWSLLCQSVGLSRLFPGSALLNPEAYGNWQRDAVRPVDIVTGCFFLIEKEFWEELGGFSEDFYIYGEEADLCLRARKKGADPHITQSATIIHYGGGTANKVMTRKRIWQLGAKSLIIRNHWGASTRPVGLFLLQLNVFLRMVGFRAMSLARPAADSEASETWSDVWMARNTWLHGFGG
jgi:GT2 family glycosyltransferase